MKRIAFILLSAGMLLAQAPFWDTKAPESWNLDQLNTLFTNSPWAQITNGEANAGPAPGLQVYLASARPMQQAEDLRRANAKKKLDDPLWDEYHDYVKDNQGKYIILAVFVPDGRAFGDGGEVKTMEKDTLLRISKRKYTLVGHFPPSSTDPYVRFVFPKDVRPGDKTLIFELYVPGVPSPYRSAEFAVKDLVYQGHQEL